MEKLVIPDSVTIETGEEVFGNLASVMKKGGEFELETENLKLNSITKAIIRRLFEEFPEKLVVPEKLKNEIFYPKVELAPDAVEKTEQNEKPALSERLGGSLLKLGDLVLYFCVIMVDMVFYSIQSIFNRKFILKDDTTKNAYYIGYLAIPIVFLLAFPNPSFQ